MAINIRFDYYHLRADKSRMRRTDGQYFFGQISMIKMCEKLEFFFNANPKKFEDNTVLLKKFKRGKKWIKWVSLEKHATYYKLLFTFNDCEVDPRIVENLKNNVLAQVVPDEHGVRSLLHIVIKTDVTDKNEANLCVQSVAGMHQNYLQAIFIELLNLTQDPDYWVVNDPMTESDIQCKPHIEIASVTTSSIIEAVNKGFLREIEFVEKAEVSESFDEHNVLGKKVKNLSFTIEDKTSFMGKISSLSFGKFINNLLEKNKDDFEAKPKIYLMLKNNHNNGETKYEYLDDVMSGLTKRVYLNWEDRDIETIKKLESTSPKAIGQCYDIMLSNF
ncbi:hypothetical protein Q5M44_02490 [Acinetobacter pittii]|uniref:hypothetical protein n=1 Tax=Acinetobacter pittii TaxID=48296 RepID=UPI0026E98B76|nr:hypothetical protein [Acinetobacter pittii]MDO7243402.1 hypothetical protein [Acinetobacter pittii]